MLPATDASQPRSPAGTVFFTFGIGTFSRCTVLAGFGLLNGI